MALVTLPVAVSITDTVRKRVVDVGARAVGGDRHSLRGVTDGDGGADDGVRGGVDHRQRARAVAVLEAWKSSSDVAESATRCARSIAGRNR